MACGPHIRNETFREVVHHAHKPDAYRSAKDEVLTMSMESVLRSIKSAQSEADALLASAQEDASKAIGDARRAASETVSEATEGATADARATIDAARAKAEAEADKVRAEGAKAAEALSSSASGRTDTAVDLLLNAIHDA